MAVILCGMAKATIVWFSPITNVPITVATKIDSRHTANGILKRAGINYHF
ncbi:hypothetical protein FACS1894172_21840 [Spirochaetia bacterium]|nr:hypothetical protein FACS1894172_21840 [Spirochaetia bacterium]